MWPAGVVPTNIGLRTCIASVGGWTLTDNALMRKQTSMLLHALQRMNRVLLEQVRSPAHMLK